MHFTSGLAATVLALSSEALAQNVLRAGITRIPASKQPNSGLQPRSSLSIPLLNNVTGGSYLVNVSLGTPPQPISLVLDTGSSDVFAMSVTADQCTSARLQREYGPCTGGQFNSSASSTYSLVNQDFQISYADSSGAMGDYFKDTITIGQSSIKQQQMGLALSTTVGSGIMGVGYAANEAAMTEYPSIIQQMVSQGIINTPLYSLYLDDLQASTGSIIFGGIDPQKYTGKLIALPVQTDSDGNFSSFSVVLSGVSVTADNGTVATLTNSTFYEPVILDSGTTLSYLPDELCDSLYAQLGVHVVQQTPYIDCGIADADPKTTIDYAFGGEGGPTIKVLLNELIVSLGDAEVSSSSLPFSNACVFGILSAGSGADASNLLGDTFLRSAYVVYDLKNNEVALAQTNFNQTDSHVSEVAADATGIPNVAGVASSATVTASATAKPGVGSGGGGGAGSSAHVSATGSSTAATAATTSTSKAAAVSTIPAFDARGLAVLGLSCLFALLGGSWVLA